MQKNITLILFLFSSIASVHSQSYSDAGPENDYQSKHNPYYWKNRRPFPGYWQQDVYYKIKAKLDETKDIITGQEELTYTNNSPDTLYYVYFNLYQNAF